MNEALSKFDKAIKSNHYQEKIIRLIKGSIQKDG